MLERIKYILLWGVVLFLSPDIQAQVDEEASGEVKDAEIVIEKERKIQLGMERKIYEFIQWTPNTERINVEPVDIQWFTYDGVDNDFTPQAPSLPKSDPSRVYAHHLKAAFGNYGSPLLDVDLTKAIDLNKRLGFNFRHQSFARGVVDDENSGSSVTRAGLYGTLLQEEFILNASLNYSFEKNFYYGYPEGSTPSRADIKHSSNFIDLGIGIADSDRSDVWAYSGSLKYQGYTDNFNARENSIMGKGHVGHSEKYFLDIHTVSSKYEDSGIEESRSYLRLNPYYRLLINDLTFDIGLSFSLQNDDYPDLNTNKFFPFVRAKYPLIEDYEVFGQLDGGFTFNSLFDFAQQTGILNQSIALANSERLIALSGGIKGRPLGQMSFVAGIDFQVLRYLPVMINNGTDQSRIDLVYDQEDSKVLKLFGEANYAFSDDHEVAIGLNLYNYSSDGYDQIYHRPTSEVFVSGCHRLLSKLSAHWNFNLAGGLVAPGRTVSEGDQNLDTIANLAIEMNYRINEQWGVFLSGNNILNQNYERYQYYTQRGAQVSAGATFRL